jgi:uncharacterized protein (TIGR02391 family)
MAENFDLEVSTIVEAPVDLLALRILRDVHVNEEWNSYNWMVKAQSGPLRTSLAALRALEEGWAWLRAKGFVAHNPTQSSETAVFVTRRGLHALEEGVRLMRAEERLDVDLHPLIASRVRSQFLLGEYELAALAAFREVEERVRELGGFADGDFGVDMINRAFSPKGGPLADQEAAPGEQAAMLGLFSGAYGVFRNPVSHRTVDLGDVTMASEVVLLADLLLRLLDRLQHR